MHPPFVKERKPQRWTGWLADLRSARVCLLLAALLVLIHGIISQLVDPDGALLRFGLSRERLGIINIWKLFTYAFIHGNSGHLLINLAGLLVMGSRVERIGGPAAVLRIFLFGAILGGLAQLVMAPPAQQGIPLVGASGGIAGLLLWLTTVSPDSRTWPFRLSGCNLGRGVVLAEAGFLAAAWFFPQSGALPVAHACHLGGALGGWWLARRLLRPSPTLEELKKERARRESADRHKSP